MTLYELTAEYQRIAEAMTSDDGELSDDTVLVLDNLEGAFADKVVGCCKLIRQFSAEGEMIDVELQRLKNMLARRDAAVIRIKALLKAALEQMGMTSFTAGLFKIRIQNSPQSISWTKKIEELPRELRREKIEFAASVAREMLKGGLPLPDGVKVEQGTHLRIS